MQDAMKIVPVECDNCGHKIDHVLWPIKDAWERLYPGDIVPDGECPDCGAMVFETTPDQGE